jgi:hypothetical protein
LTTARAIGLSAALLLCAIAATCAPAALAGGISGTVSADGSGVPIAGVEVCPRRQPYTVETACATTDAGGRYALAGLPEGAYSLDFSTARANLKYVGEFYSDKRHSWEADLVSVGSAATVSIDAQLAEGGSLAGTLTEQGTGRPATGVRACAIDSEGIPVSCSVAGPGGEYRLNGLPSGSYSVEYEGGNRVNFLAQFYAGAQSWAAATKLNVTAPALSAGVDDQLAPGAEILGHVHDIAGGSPPEGVFICAIAQVGEFEDCTTSEAGGAYALRSLPQGSYLVGFGVEYVPFGGRTAEQWWMGQETMAEATPIEIVPPQAREGVDGSVSGARYAKPSAASAPLAIAGIGPVPAGLRPLRCRRNFRRKSVRGKVRCVKTRRHRRAARKPHRR